MGTFVQEIAEPAFEWGDLIFPGTGSDLTKELVEQKFNQTMGTAEEMLERLVGSDGGGGYLGAMNSAIEEYVAPVIEATSLLIPDIGSEVATKPSIDLDSLDTDFGTFDTVTPTFISVPTVDLSGLTDVNAPDDISTSIGWVEENHNSATFTYLVNKLINDIQGATGLGDVIEQELWDRAEARLENTEDATLIEMEEFFAAKGFDLPTGAQASRVQEFLNEKVRNRADLTGKIAIEQAELIQKNTQFAIEMCNTLEAVLLNATSKNNDRSLDFAKAVAANTIQLYAEQVKAYLATIEGNKILVEVQIENIKAVIEQNKGLVDIFKAEADVFSTVVDSKVSKNSAIIDAFEAEVAGYDSETKAISSQAQSKIGEWGLKLQNADMVLKAAIAEGELALGGYTSESSLKQGIAKDMANISMQTVASAYGSVNMSAGLSHATGRHQSESVSHGETRTDGHSKSNSLGESHNYDEKVV